MPRSAGWQGSLDGWRTRWARRAPTSIPPSPLHPPSPPGRVELGQSLQEESQGTLMPLGRVGGWCGLNGDPGNMAFVLVWGLGKRNYESG